MRSVDNDFIQFHSRVHSSDITLITKKKEKQKLNPTKKKIKKKIFTVEYHFSYLHPHHLQTFCLHHRVFHHAPYWKYYLEKL